MVSWTRRSLVLGGANWRLPSSACFVESACWALGRRRLSSISETPTANASGATAARSHGGTSSGSAVPSPLSDRP
eukprot:12026250-Alexandrium_andersonii.AAC.1